MFHSRRSSTSEYTSQATTYTNKHRYNIPPPLASPLDTVCGENGSDDDSDGVRLLSRLKLKRRSTISGSREYTLTKEAQGANIKRLSAGTTRSSDRDLLWENGGSSEEISAASLRKEKKHRARAEREREMERDRELKSKDERERQKNKPERRDSKLRSKTENERPKTGQKTMNGVPIIPSDKSGPGSIRIAEPPQSSFHPAPLDIPLPPPKMHPEQPRRSVSPTKNALPPSPPQSAGSQGTSPPAVYPRGDIVMASTPPQSPPEAVQKPPQRPSLIASNTSPSAASKIQPPATATTRTAPPSPTSEKRSRPASPVLDKKKTEVQEQFQPPAPKKPSPRAPPIQAESNTSTTTVIRRSPSAAKPSSRQTTPPMRITDPPPPPRITDPIPKVPRISDPPPPPQPVSKRPRSPSPTASALSDDSTVTQASSTKSELSATPEVSEVSESPLIQAHTKREPEYTGPHTAGPWFPPAPAARTRGKRPVSVPYGAAVEEDQWKKTTTPRSANPYPGGVPPPYFPETGFAGYPYPAYDLYNTAYQYDGYATPTSARDLERPDPFQYMNASQTQKAARPGRSRQQRPTGREHYDNAAVVKSRGEETESDLYSDAGSTGGWTTRSVSRDSSPEGTIVKDVDGRNVAEEHREQAMKVMLRERKFMEKQLQEKQSQQKFQQEKRIQEEQKRLQEEKGLRDKSQHQQFEEQVKPKQTEEQEKLKQQEANENKLEEEQQKSAPMLQDAPVPFRERKAVPSELVASASEDESESSDEEEEEEDEKELSPMPGQLAPETPERNRPETMRSEPQAKSGALPEVVPKTSVPRPTGPSLFDTTRASLPKRKVYRRFSALNHRVLLHMQDEISELSSLLDKMDSQFPSQAGIHNAGRMLYPSLEERRQQLLNNIAWKLSNYNQAVKAYQDSLTLPSAAADDVEAFGKNALNSEADGKDLMAVDIPSTPPPSRPKPMAENPPAPPRFALGSQAMQGLTIAAVLLAPLMSGNSTPPPISACASASETAAVIEVAKMGWGMWLLRALMWVFALTPATVSLLRKEKKVWWDWGAVAVGLVAGLTAISM